MCKGGIPENGGHWKKEEIGGEKRRSLDTNILHKHKPHVGAASSSQLG